MSVPARTQIVSPETEQVELKIASLKLTGSPLPLKLGQSLDAFKRANLTPIIGTEFERGVQLTDWLKAPNADQLIKDLGILGASDLLTSYTAVIIIFIMVIIVSQRGVVFFRDQNIAIEEQKLLGSKLGELTGKPESSKLHIFPTSEMGNEISVISSKTNQAFFKAAEESGRFIGAYVCH